MPSSQYPKHDYLLSANKHEEMVAKKILSRIDQALQIPQFEKVSFELFI